MSGLIDVALVLAMLAEVHFYWRAETFVGHAGHLLGMLAIGWLYGLRHPRPQPPACPGCALPLRRLDIPLFARSALAINIGFAWLLASLGALGIARLFDWPDALLLGTLFLVLVLFAASRLWFLGWLRKADQATVAYRCERCSRRYDARQLQQAGVSAPR